jgi:hypothetical protein
MKQNNVFADHGTTVTELRRSYALARIKELRRQRPSRMPIWLKQKRDAYRDRLLALAEKSYADTGIWFLARGATRVSDEMETRAIWGDLLIFVKLEELPGYSEANQRKAVAFWRSWQNRNTGRIYNPLYQDPQNPDIRRQVPGNRDDYAPDKINMKYVPSILSALGAELPMPIPGIATQVRADTGQDVFDHLWESIALCNPSHAGAFPVDASMALEAGDESKIPQVEAGIGALLRAYNRETGMWRPEPLEGFPWRDYQPSSGFKIISRICGYVGMENFPEALFRTAVDNLLVHRHELYDHPAMARNYGEMFAHYLMLSDYRCEEQLDAMEECLCGFRKPELWESTDTSTYCIFGTGLIGAFMNWEDLPLGQATAEWQRFVHGCDMKWRFVADPYGNWINVIPKRPEEVFGHPEYDVTLYGIKARNRTHWARQIIEVVRDRHLPLRGNPDGHDGIAKFAFTLDRDAFDQLKAPHLKACWNGAFDVSLNCVPVKQVRYNLPDVFAGWNIPAEAAKTLHAGENVIEARLVGPGKCPTLGAPLSTSTPFIQLGIIDWR